VTPITVYRSDKVEVRNESICGRGVFARQAISAGEIVAIKAGHIVNHEEVIRLTNELGDYSLQIHDNFYLSPRTEEEVEQTTIFINHSCDANVGFEGQIVYVAIRDIEADEELCHDYAMVRNDDYHLECRCGSSQCRGQVTGKDWQLPAVQQQYGKYFSDYILRKIRG
jgi:SET domain-containing protein